MINMVLYLRELPRLVPGERPLAFVGYLPVDLPAQRIQGEIVHPTLNFCLTLDAKGTLGYEVDGKMLAAAAPFLAIQRPGMRWRNLASNPVSETLYFSYDATLLERFSGFDTSRVMRPLIVTPQLADLIKRVLVTMRDIHDHGNVDRLDRLAETTIVEALLSSQEEGRLDPTSKAIRKIASWVGTHFAEEVDLDRMLTQYGLSRRTFTRRWAEFQHLPFKRYVDKLRIEEAKRLLSQGGLRVHEVARQVGFHDPYYFSRRFSEYEVLSPRDYARANRGQRIDSV